MTVAKTNSTTTTTTSAGTSVVVSKKTKDSSKDISVAVRIRPLSSDELNQGCNSVVQSSALQPNVLHLGLNKQFEFSHVFSSDSSQESIYQYLVSPLLDSFFDGYNATVLAYGQTGSGKTFTMGTEFRVQDISPEQKGVLPRVMEEVFERVATLESTSQAECSLSLSYLEILNEEIQDLLVPENSNLPIREDQKKGMIIAGLSEHRVKTLEDVMALLSRGGLHRATASTSMNSSSSRSHAICTLTFEQTLAPDSECPHGEYKFSKFHLVDLAGSERAKKTKAKGDRFREGVNINKGLLALGNVIGALTAGDKTDGTSSSSASTHIPYRDSKITRLLQDSLGGNSKTAMIACVSPADSNFDESNSTLKYAQRARKIQNKAVINRDAGDMEVSYLRQQVQLLQLQLLSGSSGGNNIQQPQVVEKLQGRIDKLQVLVLEKQKKLNDMVEARNQWKAVALAARQELEASSRTESTEGVSSSQVMIRKIQALEDLIHQDQGDHSNDPNEDLDLGDDLDDDDDDENPLNVSTTSSYSGEIETKTEMEDISNAISAKEEILQAIRSSDDQHMRHLQTQYEKKISHYESQIALLERQKRDWIVEAKKTSSASNKTTNASKDQLKTLEVQVSKYRKDVQQLRKSQEEAKRLKKMYESGTLRISSLQNEVLDMKTQRTSMQKKLRVELEKHRKDKRAKELQISQLQRQEQRKTYQYEKLERLHKKQQHVLKRKTEEMATAQKRLRTLDSRKKTGAGSSSSSLARARGVSGSSSCRSVSKFSTKSSFKTSSLQMIDVEEYIDTRLVLRASQEAIAAEIQDRKTLSQALVKPETTLEEKNRIRNQIRAKALAIREMQEKVAAVEKSSDSSATSLTLRDAQEIISVLMDRAVATSDECDKERENEEMIKRLQREHQRETLALQQQVQHLLTQVDKITALTSSKGSEALDHLKSEDLTKVVEMKDQEDLKPKDLMEEEEKEDLMEEEEEEDLMEEEEEESDDSDSDYIDSPERKTTLKSSLKSKASTKPSSTALNLSKEIDDLLEEEEEEEEEEGMDCCNCVGRCITNCCPCKLRSVQCSLKCKCDEHKCTNQCSKVPPPVLVKKKKNSKTQTLQSSNKENAASEDRPHATSSKRSLSDTKTTTDTNDTVTKGKGLHTRDLNQKTSAPKTLLKTKTEPTTKKLWSR